MATEREKLMAEEIQALRRAIGSIDKVSRFMHELLLNSEHKNKVLENLCTIRLFKVSIIKEVTKRDTCQLIDNLIIDFTFEPSGEDKHVYDSQFVIKQLLELKTEIKKL